MQVISVHCHWCQDDILTKFSALAAWKLPKGQLPVQPVMKISQNDNFATREQRHAKIARGNDIDYNVCCLHANKCVCSLFTNCGQFKSLISTQTLVSKTCLKIRLFLYKPHRNKDHSDYWLYIWRMNWNPHSLTAIYSVIYRKRARILLRRLSIQLFVFFIKLFLMMILISEYSQFSIDHKFD